MKATIKYIAVQDDIKKGDIVGLFKDRALSIMGICINDEKLLNEDPNIKKLNPFAVTFDLKIGGTAVHSKYYEAMEIVGENTLRMLKGSPSSPPIWYSVLGEVLDPTVKEDDEVKVKMRARESKDTDGFPLLGDIAEVVSILEKKL